MNNFDELLKTKVEKIERIIDEYCPKEEGLQKLIIEAMNYSIKVGGKRLRPIFLLESMSLFTDNIDEGKPFVAAIEMIHTYSLVHDDLPAMDNDELRRGMMTTHAKYGEDIGILAGDGLLNYAYEIMSKAVLTSENPYNAAKAMNTLATKSGIYGMVGGQTVDVLNEDKSIDINTIDFIHSLKTGALIEAALMCGAILGNANDDDIKKIEKIGHNIGMAFQIKDDILDVTSSKEKLGKPVLSDEKNNKDTYVTIMGIEKSEKLVEDYSKKAIELLNSLSGTNEFLEELIIKLINREK